MIKTVSGDDIESTEFSPGTKCTYMFSSKHCCRAAEGLLLAVFCCRRQIVFDRERCTLSIVHGFLTAFRLVLQTIPIEGQEDTFQ
jgi:hypothetical protein